jgi:hypothetical protein
MLGWIILMIPFAMVGYAGMRLAPVYLNYMKVARTLEQTKSEAHATDSLALLRSGIQKHLDVESVDYPSIKEIKITRNGQSWVVNAAYDDQAPLFSNIFILVTFDKTVTIGSSGGNE